LTPEESAGRSVGRRPGRGGAGKAATVALTVRFGLVALLVTLAIPACASGGWYLMAPPPCADSLCKLQWMGAGEEQVNRPDADAIRVPDEHAPLSRWIRWSSYDSSQACEEERAFAVRDAFQRVQQLREAPISEFLAAITRHRFALASRCIASDDPGLGLPR
jgi:hypothetical protein